MIQFLIFFVLAASAVATPYETCDEDMPQPTELRVTDCEEPPCKFIRGKDVNAEVDFTPTEDITKLKPFVQATVLGATINYTLPETDGCKTLKDQQCPLKKNGKYTFLLDLPILKAYPPVTLKVRLALLDEDTLKTVSCFKITGKVQ